MYGQTACLLALAGILLTVPCGAQALESDHFPPPAHAAARPFYAWAPPMPGRSIWVDKSRQRLYAFAGTRLILEAACSTAAHYAHYAPGDDRYEMPSTPLGSFHVFEKTPDHYSRAYQVHMRYALFYDGGRAIHATYPNEYRMLGRPASGGCVRLTRSHAVTLYQWAQVGDPVHVVRALPRALLAMVEQSHPRAPVMVAVLRHPERPARITPMGMPAAPAYAYEYDHELAEASADEPMEPAAPMDDTAGSAAVGTSGTAGTPAAPAPLSPATATAPLTPTTPRP